MLSPGLPRKPGTIAIVLDEHLSRERTNTLNRIINSIRTFTTVEVLSGTTSENVLVEKMQTSSPDLVLVPWHKYLAWARAEGFWGLTRTSGPTIAGYFCEQLLPEEIGESAEHLRAIFLDFTHLQHSEIHVLIKSLQKNSYRSGIKPLLDPNSKIYCESWYGSQGLGTRIDSVLGLPELTADPKWTRRGNSMRICLNALWSMIYEEGPGKGENGQINGHYNGTVPKGYFQVSCDRDTTVFRLCYQMPNLNPKTIMETFWPNTKAPTIPSQLLARYSDFLRVHTFASSPEIEIVVGFFPSSPAENAHGQLHSFWVEPLADNLYVERPYETPSPNSPRLRPLPEPAPQDSRLRAVEGPDAKVIELETQLKKKEEMINNLKSGGVGTAAALPPPDTESLIEAFQERYYDARFQIRQLELEIVSMEKKGATPEEFANIRQKMEALANREQAWIKKLSGTLEMYRTARKK